MGPPSSSGEPLLLRCRYLLPCARCRVLRDVYVYIEGGRVSYVGASPPPGSRSGFVVECPRRSVALPCLYNAHTHAAMVLLRGYHDDSELGEWLEYMWFVEKSLTPEVVYHASRMAVVEMVFSATCGFLDMYFHPEATARAALELGVRARVGHVVMGRVDPWRAVEEAARLAARLEGEGGGLVGGVMNVHSIYASPLEAVRLAASKARELGVPFHIHVSETRREVYEAKKRYGVFPVELLDRLGAVWEGSVLVHAGWIASWELGLVREKGATLVHCPSSNMKLATAGHLPFYEAVEMGVNVALGTDGAASNNTLDMLREMRIAVLLQRHAYWDTRVKAVHALEAATQGSARALMLQNGGVIREGAPGDVAVVGFERPGMPSPEPDRLVSGLVYSGQLGDATHLIVGGRLVLSPENREELLEAYRESSRRVEEFAEKTSGGRSSEPPCWPPTACS